MKLNRGFTIIELMVTMVLLGALSAMAVPRYHQYKSRAYRSALTSDLVNLRLAEESHWADHQAYTTDTTALEYRGTSEVKLSLHSADLYGGYTAVATHDRLPGEQCATYMGREAAGNPSGAIICGPVPIGPGQLGSPTP